jgi:adenosylhomocysteinase
VAELDPVRLLEAQHLGCESISLKEGLSQCQIIVTATGTEVVLKEEHLHMLKPGAILFNAGQLNREIDIEWLASSHIGA